LPEDMRHRDGDMAVLQSDRADDLERARAHLVLDLGERDRVVPPVVVVVDAVRHQHQRERWDRQHVAALPTVGSVGVAHAAFTMDATHIARGYAMRMFVGVGVSAGVGVSGCPASVMRWWCLRTEAEGRDKPPWPCVRVNRCGCGVVGA